MNRARAAEEGATAAQHLLGMCMRAIDYLPPVEFEFPDFLNALLVSDAEMVPDDNPITAPPSATHSPSGASRPRTTASRTCPSSASHPSTATSATRRCGATRTRFLRFIWENLEFLHLDPRFYIHVEHVRPTVRVGPDGMVVAETVAEYVQFLDGTPAGLYKAIGLPRPERVPDGTQVRVFGGGTIVFDQFGRAKYHHRKDLRDTHRQLRRLNYLLDNGLFDGRSLGVSDKMPEGQRFAMLHQPDTNPRETW